MYEDNNIEILVKLFETLKDSSKRSEEMTQRLVMQQVELVNKIKSLPVEDLRVTLKEHAKDSKTDIDDCSGSIEIHTSEIKELLTGVVSKVNKMILVVSVAFSIFGIIYTLTKIVTDESKTKQVTVDTEKIKKELRDERDQMINKMINEIRKDIQDLHKTNQVDNKGKVNE